MANNFGIRLTLRNMDDNALQLAIDRQEELISITPAMKPIIEPGLAQFREERDRRLNANIGLVLDNVFASDVDEPVGGTSDEASRGKAVYTTPIRAPTVAQGRSKRVRMEPDHFDNQSKPLAIEADALKRHKPSLHDKMYKRPEFRCLMDQMEQNKVTIKTNAARLSCPLLVADEVAKGNYNDNDADFLLRTQMKQVAVADDGYQYDFARIKSYIRDRMGQALLSPVTGEPMSGQVYFTETLRTKSGDVIYTGQGVNRVPKVRVRAWQPTLNPERRPQ